MRTSLFVLLLLSRICHAQAPVDALVSAEKGFAALAAKTTTRGAFLYYLDSSSVVFNQGKIMNGYARWSRDIPEDNSLLLWRPELAVLSASGDFGCTVGASEYRPDRSAQAAGQFGHFASLWHRSAGGRWSVLCTIGVQHSDPAADENRVVRKVLQRAGSMSLDIAEAAAREGQLIEGIKAGRSDLLKQYSAPDAWILLEGRQPVRSREMDDFDAVVPGRYLFEPAAGRWLSPAGDMLVSYGRTTANGKAANYLWVWVAERGKWQLMMMVMN